LNASTIECSGNQLILPENFLFKKALGQKGFKDYVDIGRQTIAYNARTQTVAETVRSYVIGKLHFIKIL
jgi:hypothetical protein